MNIAKTFFDTTLKKFLTEAGYDTKYVPIPSLDDFVSCKNSYHKWCNKEVQNIYKHAYVISAVKVASQNVDDMCGCESRYRLLFSGVSIVNDCIIVFNTTTGTAVFAIDFADVDNTTMSSLVSVLTQVGVADYERLGAKNPSEILKHLATTYGVHNKTSKDSDDNKVAITIATIISDYAAVVTPMSKEFMLQYIIDKGDGYEVVHEPGFYRVSIKGYHRQMLLSDEVVDIMLGKNDDVMLSCGLASAGVSLHEFTLDLVKSIMLTTAF